MSKEILLKVIIACSIAVLPVSVMWFIKYDSVCGFASNCNGGINPIVRYGWPLTFRESGLFSSEKVYPEHVALFYVISAGIVFGFLTLTEQSKSRK